MKRISAVDRPDGSCPAMAAPVAKRPKLDAPPAKLEPMLPTAVEPATKGLPPSAVKFMAKASIENFDRQHVQLPMRHWSYNDDVEVEAYKPPALAYAGKQRRCIQENPESRASMREHVSRVLREHFPLSVETPLPKDTLGAAVFSRDCPPGQLRSFWASQLCKLEKMALYSELTQQKWDKAIPDGIKPAAGKLKTVALSHLMRQCVLKGEKSGFACLPMASRLPGNCRRGLRISCRRSTKRFFPAPAYMRQLPLASRNAQLNLVTQMPR